jgi:hypothetical protein
MMPKVDAGELMVQTTTTLPQSHHGEKKDLEKELPSDTVNNRHLNLRFSKNWVHRNHPAVDLLSRCLMWPSSVSSLLVTL